MTILIRRADAGDYQAICDLIPSEEELFLIYPEGTYPLTVEQVEKLFNKRWDPTVLLDDGKVIGFANFYSYRKGRSVYIGNVVIDRSQRGRGLGKQIILYLIEKAFDDYALPEVRIAVFSQNTSALLLYAALGFRPYRVREKRDFDGNRVALIQLRLRRDRFERSDP